MREGMSGSGFTVCSQWGDVSERCSFASSARRCGSVRIGRNLVRLAAQGLISLALLPLSAPMAPKAAPEVPKVLLGRPGTNLKVKSPAVLPGCATAACPAGILPRTVFALLADCPVQGCMLPL